MRLAVVIPTYNEADNLPLLINSLFDIYQGGLDLSVVVVDDASPDGTGEVADRLSMQKSKQISVIHRTSEKSFARACLEGMCYAMSMQPDLIAQMDADLSHDPAFLPVMVEAIHDADVVIGSRYVQGGCIDPCWAWHRKALSRMANLIVVPDVLDIMVRDSTSGYRLWRRETLMRIDPFKHVRSDGYAFQVEMVYLAAQLDCRIREVPIYFRERAKGRSKMSLGIKINTVWDIINIRRKYKYMKLQSYVPARSSRWR